MSDQPAAVALPAIPIPTQKNFMPTLLALMQTVRQISGQLPQSSTGANPTTRSRIKDRWKEISRVTTPTTINGQTFSLLTQVVFQDTVTGERFTWAPNTLTSS